MFCICTAPQQGTVVWGFVPLDSKLHLSQTPFMRSQYINTKRDTSVAVTQLVPALAHKTNFIQFAGNCVIPSYDRKSQMLLLDVTAV